jgi:regulator of RNase E activity RraB
MIRSAGTEMDRLRQVGHFCYFPSEQAAVAAAQELVEAVPEFSVEVYETDAWVVHAAQEAILTGAYIAQWRPRLSALAEKHGGGYDGWDADADAPGAPTT